MRHWYLLFCVADCLKTFLLDFFHAADIQTRVSAFILSHLQAYVRTVCSTAITMTVKDEVQTALFEDPVRTAL